MKWKINKDNVTLVIKDNNEIAIRLLFSIYLDSFDKSYTTRLVEEKKLKSKSVGKALKTDNDYVKTGVMINNPLHNHFVMVPVDCGDSLINSLGDQILSIVSKHHTLGHFDNNQLIEIPNTYCYYNPLTDTNVTIGNARVTEILNNLTWQ